MGTQRKVLQKPITKSNISVLSFQKIIPIELDLREPTHVQCAREQMGSHLVINYKKFQEYSHLLEFPFARE